MGHLRSSSAVGAAAVTTLLIGVVARPATGQPVQWQGPVAESIHCPCHTAAPAADGGVISLWQTSSSQYSMQRLDPDGVPLWSTALEPGEPGVQPFLVTTGASETFVIWGGVAGQPVEVQRYDASGQAVWPSAVLVHTNVGDGSPSAVFHSPEFFGPPVLQVEMEGRVATVTMDGSVLPGVNGAQLLPSEPASDAFARSTAQIVFDGQAFENGFFMVWSYFGEQYAQHFNITAQWPDPVELGVGSSVAAALGHPDAGLLAAWQQGSSVRVQRVNYDGTLAWGAGGVSVVDSASISGADLVATHDNAGGIIVAWTDDRAFDDLAEDVYAQRVDEDGTAVWGAGGVLLPEYTNGPLGTQRNPLVQPDGAGGAAFLWTDFLGHGCPNIDPFLPVGSVAAAHIMADGTRGWDAFFSGGVCYNGKEAAYVQHVFPEMVSINDGTFIGIWYAALFLEDGGGGFAQVDDWLQGVAVDVFAPPAEFCGDAICNGGESCDTCPGDCGPCPGACCLQDGSCIEASQAECGDADGLYLGDLSTCMDADCPQPQGACCLPASICAELDAADCAASGGAFQGALTSCMIVQCTPGCGDGDCDNGLLLADPFLYTLDPAWEITFQNADGWDIDEAPNALLVQDITPSPGEDVADVLLSRPFSGGTGDFALVASIGWDSEDVVQAMQTISLELLDGGGDTVASVGMVDAWLASLGSRFAAVEGVSTGVQAGTVSDGGSPSVTIERSGGTMSVRWDGELLLSEPSASDVTTVQLRFRRYVVDGAFLGELRVAYLGVAEQGGDEEIGGLCPSDCGAMRPYLDLYQTPANLTGDPEDVFYTMDLRVDVPDDADWFLSEVSAILGAGQFYEALVGDDVPLPAEWPMSPELEYDSWYASTQGLDGPVQFVPDSPFNAFRHRYAGWFDGPPNGGVGDFVLARYTVQLDDGDADAGVTLTLNPTNRVYALVQGYHAAAVSDSPFAIPVYAQGGCDGDTDGSGEVDTVDLVSIILAWGPCPPGPCPEDVNGDGVVDVSDLVEVVTGWGGCE